MTFRHLQIFLETAACGKMSLAASRLFLSQPTVSQAIGELEKHYHTKLFERYPKGLVLTESGRILQERAREVMAACQKLEETMLSSQQALPLHIGATVTVGACVIHSILHRFRDVCPQADPRVYVNNTRAIEDRLLKGQLDIALVEGEVQSPDLTAEPVIQDYLVPVCCREHPFARRDSVSLEELAGQPLILREQGSGTRALFENYMAQRGYSLDIRWECTNAGTIKTAVLDNQGISVLSVRLVEEEIRSGKICVIPVRDGVWSRSFSLVRHRHKFLSEEMRGFIQAAAAYEDRQILELLPGQAG